MSRESNRGRIRPGPVVTILMLMIVFVSREALAFEAAAVPNLVVQGDVNRASGYQSGVKQPINAESFNRELTIDAVFARLQAEEEPVSRKEAIDLAMQEAGQQLAQAKTAVKQDLPGAEPFLSRLSSHYHPYIKNSLDYDDNVDTANEDQTASVVNTSKPGIKMNYRGRKWSLVGDFNYTNKFYHNYRNSDFDSAEAMMQATLNLGRNLVTLFDQFTYYHPAKKDYSGAADADVVSVGKNYRKNDFRTTFGRGFKRLGFDLAYNRIDYKYEPAFEDENFHSQKISFKPYWRISRKTRITGGYAYYFEELTDIGSPDDSRYQDFSLAFFNRLTAKISDEIRVEQRLTDNKSSSDERYTNFICQFAYGFSPRTNLSLECRRKIFRESNRQNNYLEDIFNLLGDHRLVFNPKIKLGLGAKATLTDYIKRVAASQERRNDKYEFLFSLDYAFRDWLDFVLSYKREINWSSLNDNSYYRNLVTFVTEARF